MLLVLLLETAIAQLDLAAGRLEVQLRVRLTRSSFALCLTLEDILPNATGKNYIYTLAASAATQLHPEELS